MKTKNGLWITTVLLMLTACQTQIDDSLNPQDYATAGDYAKASILKTTCMGRIDNLFFPVGWGEVDSDGIMTFRSNHAETNCSIEDFDSLMDKYCRNKGGNRHGNWCEKDQQPLFWAEKFTVREPSKRLSTVAWQNVARSTLGYRSAADYEWEQRVEARRKMEAERLSAQHKQNIVVAKIGDLICTEDFVSAKQYDMGRVYYRAWVEEVKQRKLRIRLAGHGGTDPFGSHFEIKGSDDGAIQWVSPRGWFKCEGLAL